MKVLVVGSGGREHAICWKLSQSAKLTELYCAPGSAGISSVAKIVPIKVDDIEGLVKFAKTNAIDLTVVGPEYPLSLGLADRLREQNLRVFGPSKAAAMLEVSKSFAKQVMNEAGVPTARHEVVNDRGSAEKILSEMGVPVVLKADGLASGKGVHVCMAKEQVTEALDSLFAGSNTAGTSTSGSSAKRSDDYRVVIEEYLPGVEISYMIATDGENIVPLSPSHDYKRIFDNDKGPNTGGMGSVCPTPRFTETDEEVALYKVMIPMISQMKKRGTPFRGFLYAGLMKAPDGKMKVLEFNVRLGDPETQAIMRSLKSDFLETLFILSDATPKLIERLPALEWDSGKSVCIVISADGYPGTPKIGDEIAGLDKASEIKDVVVFHAGTEARDGKFCTAGGRVLSVTAKAETLEEARNRAYSAADCITFRGRHYRKDVALG